MTAWKERVMHERDWRGIVFSIAAGVSALCALALASSAAAETTVSFTTQGCTTWTVPMDVTSVQMRATGAAGGGGGGGAPGLGDGISGTLPGLAGGTQVLDVCVNQGGGLGRNSGGGGGGASGVSLGSDFSAPALVAGGGGGGGAFGGGGAGGSAGMPIASPGASTNVGGGGGGNNTTAMGGAAGTSTQPLCNGVSGGQFDAAGPGSGGASGASLCGDGGGAGGGGYYGGGGGASSGIGGGGGGGGSDFCAEAITTCTVSSGAGTHTTAGPDTGDAQVTITYTANPPAPPNSTATPGKDPKCKRLRKKLRRQQMGLAKAGRERKQAAIEVNIKDTKKRLQKLGC
jgi:hypothetical protein